MSNYRRTVLYCGITNDLSNRSNQHAAGLGGDFSSTYKVTKLLYFEAYENPRQAISREKEVKGWKREKKESLIRRMNPGLDDLRPTLVRT